MKIKFRYIIICVLILAMFKAIDMYKKHYPVFTSKLCGNVTEFVFGESELYYNLFFIEEPAEDIIKSKSFNLFVKNNVWDKKVLTGQGYIILDSMIIIF